MTDISVGQIWAPAPDKRAATREVVGLKLDPDGYPAVVYLASTLHEGYVGKFLVRKKTFRDWIRKTQAMCEDRYD